MATWNCESSPAVALIVAKRRRDRFLDKMPPKFVPRQRKHKVIARNKSNAPETTIDSNATEILPSKKSDHEEKKQRLREELNGENKVSGKKAKRLEKYIESKLRKDENRILIEKLSQRKEEGGLYESSRKLGQGGLTRRERLGRALKERQSGLDIDGDGEELLFEKRTVRDAESESSEEDKMDEDPKEERDSRASQMPTTVPKPVPVPAVVPELIPPSVPTSTPAPQLHFGVGTGLKRPLEVDGDGKPVIQKRQRRGGVKSKIQLRPEAPVTTEPEWEGFDSGSEAQSSDEEEDSDSNSDASNSISENGSENGEEDSDDDEEDDTSEEESDEENQGENPFEKAERSSAFKAWANQQINEAYGYQPTSNIPNATETPKIDGFKPRPAEQDPLPMELQPTSNLGRKAFSVSIERPSTIQDVRLKLPVVAEEQKIMEAIHNNNLVVVYGATGSGKTTQVPQFLYEAGYGTKDSPNPGMIGVTQPRRVAAVSMAKRVGDELADHGKRVAYQIRFEGTVSPDTAIKFMTDGVLLREVAQDIALRKYSAIVIDEAHERSVNTDILIGMLSRVVKLREELAQEDPAVQPLKLIIMSATLRVTDFTQNQTLFSSPPPVLQAEGRQYPISHAKRIMIMLRKHSEKSAKGIENCHQEDFSVFEPPPDGSRLIVLATNVAETSLTIPGIRYVFDCGRSKERKFDKTTGVQSFEVGWISKASASQRAGRAGRTGPGHCYRLYSSAVYERDFDEFAEPEILRMPIEGVVLQLKSMNLQHVVNFPFPTPPDRQSLASAEKLLAYLSAISPSGQITPTGSTMSIFPLSPRFARILLVGHLHDCLPYTIALVAGLSAADIFIPENQIIPAATPRDEDTYLTTAEKIEMDARANLRRQFNKVHQSFTFLDDRSDAIKLLQAVGEFAHEPTEAWCASHYVRYKTLKEISQLRRQITDLLRTNIPAFAALKYEEKLSPPSPKQVKALKQMVAAGFIDHVAIRADLSPTPSDSYRKPTRAIDVPYLTLFPSHLRQSKKSDAEDEDKAVYIHPASPLAHLSPKECPEYIIYSYLQRPPADPNTPHKKPKTRMHALTDVSGGQLAALAKGTSLLEYGKPIKEVMPKGKLPAKGEDGETRECWVVPYLRAEGTGGMGWPLPARKVVQRKVKGKGWVVE
ncbi:hypothetical protein CJF31_00011704 [Rutstroemia sp. NJR-2017a BVV2]|nr:hypothetical protein CJF31_00011704 [Rutstroemia sp. NJR-2017a BVV2]